jgi:hypothetical protein
VSEDKIEFGSYDNSELLATPPPDVEFGDLGDEDDDLQSQDS